MMILNGTVYVKKEVKHTITTQLIIKDSSGNIFNPKSSETKEKIDLDENFWLLFATGNKIFMHNHNQGTLEEYQSIEEVNEKFIPLEQFLEQSSYYGRKLILPAGSEFTKNGKTFFYTKDKEKYIILFILNDALIIKSLEEDPEYRLVSRFNPEFSKYVIGNEINPEYFDKRRVYQDIIAQIYHKEKKEDQEMKR